MNIMFIDESGDHNLDPAKVQPNYPLFVLVGCIFEESYYKETVIPRFNEFKKSFFGSDDIILHTLELTRPHRSKDKRYLKLRTADFRIKFYIALNKLISELEFVLAACVIKKVDHVTQYGLEALDPYLLSFNFLLDECISELKERQQSKIIAEKRNDNLDNQLELAWLNLKINGTENNKGSEIKDRVENLYMIPKSANDPGLQIADLIANPIGRYVLGIKKVEPGHEVEYVILKKKLRNADLTVLPK